MAIQCDKMLKKFTPKKKLLPSKNFTHVNIKKKLKFTNWYSHENLQRLIRKIFRVQKSCTGVARPRSCGFHAKIYNKLFSTITPTLPFLFRLDSESGSSICRFLFLLFGGFWFSRIRRAPTRSSRVVVLIMKHFCSAMNIIYQWLCL